MYKRIVLALSVLLLADLNAYAQEGVAVSIRSGTSDPANCRPSSRNVFFNRTTPALKVCTAADTWTALLSASTGAPSDATYITQTANGSLSAEQALSVLGSGYVKNTTGTGVLSVQAVPIPIADGGTNAVTDSAARTSLGLAIGTNVQAWDAQLDDLAASGVSITATRLTADFSTATLTNRFSFMSSVLNGVTTIHCLPNGSATTCGFRAYANSDPTNGAYIGLLHDGNAGIIQSTRSGSGTSQELQLKTGDTATVAIECSPTQLCAASTNVPDGAGKLQVQIGASTGNAKVGGSEWYSVTEVGNVGTGEDALIPAQTILAASLSNDGGSLHFTAGGTTANNANVKRLRVRLIEGANDNVIYDAGAAAIITNSDWRLECDVVRESATVFKSTCSISTTSVSGLVYADGATGTYTFANAGTIAVTAEATTNDDVVMEWWKGWWSSAP